MFLLFRPLVLAATLACPALLSAAVVGTNVPALPLTAARINALPASEQPVWHRYLAQSRAQAAIDAATLATELKAAGLSAPLVPAKGRGLPLFQPAAFWSTPEAARRADNLISFQTPAGGWNKNTDFTTAPRRPGERSGIEAGYVGTIDNDATIAPLRFLAKTVSAADPAHPHYAAWKASFVRGIDYLLAAQFPNGGWPQVYPLEGSYHDAITFNDGAIINVLSLLRAVAAGRDEFAFVPAALGARALAAYARGLDCILASQITVAGRRTVWCQQVDVLTLAPVGARNYEMPSQSSGESAGIVLFLMMLPQPSPRRRRRRALRRRVVSKNSAPRRRLQTRPRRHRPQTPPVPRRRPALAALLRDRLRPPDLRRPRPHHPRRRFRNFRRTPQRLRVVHRRPETRPRSLPHVVKTPPAKVVRPSAPAP
jgi:PelA/Pel-15E family pectate lyase